MLRPTGLCLAAVLLVGCGGGDSGTAADDTPDQGATTTSEQAPQAPAAEDTDADKPRPIGEDVCAAATAVFAGEVAQRIEQGEIDAAIDAYDDLAAQAPAEIADDAAVVRDALSTVREALQDSGLDEETLGALVSGDASTITSLSPADIAALQQVGEKLTRFITSNDYITATQNLVAYYSENCTP